MRSILYWGFRFKHVFPQQVSTSLFSCASQWSRPGTVASPCWLFELRGHTSPCAKLKHQVEICHDMSLLRIPKRADKRRTRHDVRFKRMNDRAGSLLRSGSSNAVNQLPKVAWPKQGRLEKGSRHFAAAGLGSLT